MRNGRENQPPGSANRETDSLAPPDLPGIALAATPLSRGPFSAVYKGWDRIHRYDVIVKVLQTAGDPVAADRFRREAEVMAKLRHPNIVALYQFHDGDPSALVMEYVPGLTLDELIAAEGALAVPRAVQIIEEIAAALDCIHAENVVHRDVKPSNILLPKNGAARLTDFGVAHIDTSTPLTVRGDMLGTIEYASPEQVQGTRAPDARSDVYSLAAVAYFALTGTPPFPAADSSMQSHLSVMHQQVFSEPPALSAHKPEISPGIDVAVRRGLAKNSMDRYPSAGQFASALRSALVAASGAPELGAMAVSSRRSFARSGALAGAALLVGGVVLLWDREHAVSPGVTSPPVQRAAAVVPPVSTPPASVLPVPVPLASVPATLKLAAPALPARPAPLLPKSVPAKPQPKTVQITALSRPVIHPVPSAGKPPAKHTTPKPYIYASLPMRLAKRAVTERPKYRRHPVLAAARAKPAPTSLVSQRLASAALKGRSDAGKSAKLAWLSVYAQQDMMSRGQEGRTEAIPAQEVTVDGKPITTLASGGWAAVPAGKHLVAFVPHGESGFGSSPGVWVTLAPGAHVSRQILLPIASRILATAQTDSSRALTASAVPVPVAPIAPAQPVLPPPPTPPIVQPQVAATAPLNVGWYTVSGWIVRNPTAPKPTLVRTSAQWVKVDGLPNLALALGQWAELPAGKHTVTFQPTHGVGVTAKTWNIDLRPQGHLDQEIPLPPMIVTPN